MKLAIKYKLNNQDHKFVTTLPIDVIVWERQTKQKFSDFYVPNADGETEFRFGYEDLSVLAWSVMKRTTGNPTPFDKWAEQIEEITFGDEPESVDPLNAEASHEPDSN